MDKTILLELITRVDPTIIEVGAHHGEDTEHFCLMYPHGKIYAFEPDERCQKIIKAKNLRAVLMSMAVTDTDGTRIFYPSGNEENSPYDGSGSTLLPTKHFEYFPDIRFMEPVEIFSVKLDTFVKVIGIEKIDFIWADIQGGEENLIKGGLNTFKTKVRYFYTEYCQTELYKGAPTRERILELLECFEIIQDIGSEVCGDMLLRNINLT